MDKELMVYSNSMKGDIPRTGCGVGRVRAANRFFVASPMGGFTIVEALIVLVVTTALFVASASVINGRQNQAAFDQAIRQIQSQIQQVLNEVSVGYFPAGSAFGCTSGANGPQLSGGSNTQGTNSACIFLGKAMQFKVGDADPEQFATYIIAGLRRDQSGGDPQSIADAKPVIVAPGQTVHSTAEYPDFTVVDKLQNGLQTVKMWYNNGGADQAVGAVAFVNSLSRGGGSVLSGTGQVDVIPVGGTTLSMSKESAVDAMTTDNTESSGHKIVDSVVSPVNPVNGVYICFSSGTTNQYGIIRIGGQNRETAVTLTIKTEGEATECS